MNLQPTQRKANSNTAVFIKSNELILDKDASILGKGGFGIVQLGIFKGERVAIKSMDLKDGKIDALSRTHLFIREAKKMLGLRHERIVAFKGTKQIAGCFKFFASILNLMSQPHL